MIHIPAISVLWFMLSAMFFGSVWRPKCIDEYSEMSVFVFVIGVFFLLLAMISLTSK